MNDIRIAEITLENYRQYYGKVNIPFPKDGSAVSVVIGGNGHGKSNLWNAVHWCLFGNEPHLKSRNTSIINNKYVLEKHDGLMTVSVQIILEQGNTKYRVKRQIDGQLHGLERDDHNVIKLSKLDPVPSLFEITNRGKLTLFQKSDNGGDWNTESDKRSFSGLVNKLIIPENLSHFFILDGEFLQELFDRLKDIKFGIDQISQINVLNEVSDMMKMVHFQKPRITGSDASAIDASIERHEQYLRSENRHGIVQESRTEHVYGIEDRMHASGIPRQRDLEKSIRNMETRLKEIHGEMEDSNIKVKMALKEQYRTLQARKKDIEVNINDAYKSYRKILVHSGPFILCKPSIKTSTALIKEEMDKGNLPNVSKRMFVGDMLEKKSCLCGTSLEIGTPARKTVEHELERIAGDIQYDIADRIRFHNETFLGNYDSMLNRINRDMENIMKLNKKLRNIKDEIKEIESKIPKESEDYSTLIGEKNSLEREKSDALMELVRENIVIDDHNRAHGDDMRKLKNVKTKSKDEQKYTLLKDKSSRVQTVLDDAIRHVTNMIREDVSKETLKTFNNLHWKKNYTNLTIDDKYAIRVTNEDGFDLVGIMSAGEKLFLALSFIMALKKITNYKFPFVIDSPLGKIAGELRENFGKHMPALLDGTQLIMLATNSEYTQDKIELEDGNKAEHNLKELFEKQVQVHEYKIKFNPEEKTAIVQKQGV